MKQKHILLIGTILGGIVIIISCFPGVTRSRDGTPTAGVITASTAQPSATISLPPTETQPLPTPTPEPAQISEGLDKVNIYLVAMGDNGASGEMIGCGDSLVAVEVSIAPTLGVLRAALTELFNLEGQAYYGQSGLYNSLNLSSLYVADAMVVDGLATVYLEGTLIYGGECDIPRIEEQLRATALQFSTVDQVKFYVNGERLEKLMDLRG